MSWSAARVGFTCALAAGLVATARSGAAQSAPSADESALADGRTALEDKRYKDAITQAARARASTEPRWKAEALEITAVAQLASGQTDAGKQTVAELYGLAPAFALNDTTLPPSVTDVFKAEAARPHPRYVPLRITPASNRAVDVVAAGEVADMRIACRERGAKAFVPIPAARQAGAFRVRLSSVRLHDCFALAVDKDDLPIGRLGSRTEPVEVRPPPPSSPLLGPTRSGHADMTSSTPITSRWWFWAAVGVVAAVGVTTVVVATTSGHDEGADENVTSTQVNRLAW